MGHYWTYYFLLNKILTFKKVGCFSMGDKVTKKKKNEVVCMCVSIYMIVDFVKICDKIMNSRVSRWVGKYDSNLESTFFIAMQ